MKTNRNDTCPCGSGRKFKHCCAHKEGGAAAPGGVSRPLLAVILLLVLGGVGYALFVERAAEPEAAPAAAPPGQVWCETHGGFHAH